MSADAVLAVAYAQQFSRRGLAAALAAGTTPAELAGSSRSRLQRAGLDAECIDALLDPPAGTLAAWREWLAAPQHALIPLGAAAYPPLLAQIPDPPVVLWTRGPDTSVLSAPQIAIVGSRNATGGGRRTAERFARSLSARGIGVTSGLAIGIDAAGHGGALDGSGGTIAVLGCGIDIAYPRINAPLYERIRSAGLIVSEYAPGTPVNAHRFPARNRIIAGLALATCVVEAAWRSGSLITARLAGEFGREVCAVPGSIHNPLTRGCHRLIRDGARLIEGPDEILAAIAASIDLDDTAAAAPEREPEAPPPLSPEYQNLLDLLGFDAIDHETLREGSGLTAAELSSMLLILEMEGYVEAMPGGRYSRLAKRD